MTIPTASLRDSGMTRSDITDALRDAGWLGVIFAFFYVVAVVAS